MSFPPFLHQALAGIHDDPTANPSRPHVTLTFAQSIDAKIAGANGQQLILSGKQSMIMTHCMRTMHDAILVGIGTALNDDPQLNTRHIPQPTNLPRPIVLDSQLRLSPESKLLKNYRAGTGRRLWIITSIEGYANHERLHALQEAGAHVHAVSTTADHTSIEAILVKLRELGVRSVMVEGGAKIIASFLRSCLIDALIVTIAPTLVGQEGIGYNINVKTFLKHFSTQVVGDDTVMIFRNPDTQCSIKSGESREAHGQQGFHA